MPGVPDTPKLVTRCLVIMRYYHGFTAHGYVVDADREDTRITIEGIEKTGKLRKDEIISFANAFCGADEFQLTDSYARCWYDDGNH